MSDDSYSVSDDAELTATLRVAAMVGGQLLRSALRERGLTDSDVETALQGTIAHIGSVPTPEDFASLARLLDNVLDSIGDNEPLIRRMIDNAAAIHEQGREAHGMVADMSVLIRDASLGLGLLFFIANTEVKFQYKPLQFEITIHNGIPPGFQAVATALTDLGRLAVAGGAKKTKEKKATDHSDE